MAKRNSKEPLREEEKRKLNKTSIKQLVGVFRFMLPYKGTFILGMLALLFSSLTLLAFPMLLGELVDVATGKSRYFNSLNIAALVLVGILFVQGIFSFIRVYTFSIVSEHGIADLRQSIHHKIIRQPLTFYDKNRVGDLMSRMTSDISLLQDTFSTTLAELFRQIITLIAGIILLFFLAPKLTAFMLLTFPVMVISAMVFGKFIRSLSKQTQEKLAATNILIEESLQSIMVVKAFTNELLETDRYKNAITEVMRFAISASRFRGLFISFLIFVLTSGIVAVVWYGATLVQSEGNTIGDLLSFILYTSFIGFSIAGLGDIYSQLQRSVGASERVFEILKEEDETTAITEEIKLKGHIEFHDVVFQYPTRQDYTVLKGLSFTIQPGEKIALVGPSGSGKSTIINLLMRFYPVAQGLIKVDEQVVSAYHLGAYRKNLGIVPQEVILFGGTIRDNIAYGKPNTTMEEIMDAANKANALDFIESFPEKFDTLVGERGVKLSGGQRQRIAIARAILKDPAILILDEATSSLDAQSEVLVQQALETLMKGRTSIIIAHRLSTIKKVDRIFVIQDGRLAETGSPEELTQLDNGIYSNLLRLQLQG